MITKEQILQATGDELSRLAGGVLQPEPSSHHTRWMDRAMPDYKPPYCRKCKCQTPYTDLCPVPDPIPITPANAFKWRNWACGRYGYTAYKQALLEIKHADPARKKLPFDLWLAGFIQSHHWIQAAMLCKIESDA